MDEEPGIETDSAHTNSALAPYVAGWLARPDDLGFVAVDADGDTRIGAVGSGGGRRSVRFIAASNRVPGNWRSRCYLVVFAMVSGVRCSVG